MKHIVSFTTSPARIHKCSEMLDSILNQSRKPDMVILNIPDIFSRTGETYDVPVEVSNKITVNHCGHDWGPAAKLVPAVQLLKERGFDPGNTRILYLDDDFRYPPEMIACLESVEAEDCIWCGRGIDYVNLNQKGRRQHGQIASIAEGFSGVSVKLSVFKDDFIEYMDTYTNNQKTRFSDDLVISNYFHKVGVPIKAFEDPGKYSFFDVYNGYLEYGSNKDALKYGANGIFDNCPNQYFRAIQELSKLNHRYFKLHFINEEKDIDIVI